MSAARSMIGLQAADAAEKLRQRKQRVDAWPYIHIFPPPNSETVHLFNSNIVAVPAVNSTVTVLTYQVPEGFFLYLVGLLQTVFTPAGSSGAGPGDLLWTVTVNQPGVPDSQASPVQGLIKIPVPLGQWQDGVWWPLPRAYPFGPDSVVRSTCTNSTGNVPAGSPNLLVSAFLGWILPAAHVE